MVRERREGVKSQGRNETLVTCSRSSERCHIFSTPQTQPTNQRSPSLSNYIHTHSLINNIDL